MMVYREFKSLEISQEAKRRVEAYLRESGAFMTAKPSENCRGAYFFMNAGVAVGFETNANSFSVEVFSHDETALKLTLEGILAVAARPSL